MDPSAPAEWISGVRTFHARWFPPGGDIQGYWFGASKASYKGFFEQLAADCEGPLNAVAFELLAGPLGAASPRWGPGPTIRLRLMTAVFLDQMCRNLAALRRNGEAASAAARLKEICDAVAVPLALSVVADAGGPDAGAGLLELGSPAELCFLSLVLRHARKQPLIMLSERVLVSISKELERSSSSAAAESSLKLCTRFLDETREAALSIDVEAYLSRALSEDEPLPLPGPPEDHPRLAVLDERCQRRAGSSERSPAGQGQTEVLFLRALLEPNSLERFEQHELVAELRHGLQRLDLLRSDRGLVLSLSGGVDSMVSLCLLWLLQRVLPPEQRFRWCALHLCHPNRGDAKDEEGWVQWSCAKLGVDFLTYRMGIRRPHGELRTGISRERYEEKSKELRFRMYERCMARLGVSRGSGVAMVMHHQDDADENRLAELGKGNIVHIDGMSNTGITLGVEVIRPMLSVRKEQLLRFAEEAGVCYMQDSTPRWSRRGWIRRLLDDIGLEDVARHSRLLTALTRAGSASEDLGQTLDKSLSGWKMTGVVPGVLEVPARAVEKSSESSCGKTVVVEVVLLKLPDLLRLAKDFEEKLATLVADFRGIAEVWNAAIAAHNSSAPETGPVVDASYIGDDGDCDDPVVNSNGAPGTCPLQRIAVCDEPPDAGPFLLGRAICAAMNQYEEVMRITRGQLVARKSLKHLWDCVARARRECQWGTLHKQCPCLYVRDACGLVLCDAKDRAAYFSDATWQRNLAAAATAFAMAHSESKS
ncbi:unnamed protein product [Polarella glacialis]|uniref:tRNA(Ile)-lysidine synthetase n=1 Tax=Polarella glacialis TaxID=89957 RepID=A0A813D9U5_POLGL|nr:unnamed protein product [Polarella glacialis]